MQKITITIDVDKIDKSRIKERTYTNKDGEEVTVREYQMDVVELKEPKVLKEGDEWVMKKTHFVAERRDKEEESNFLGDGISFSSKKSVDEKLNENYPTEDISPGDIPF